jgi:hypothetical protein
MSRRRQKLLVFVSYAPFDDKHDRGRITSLAKVLSQEAKLEIGEDVSVSYDRQILRGTSWKDTIHAELDEASVFIAFVTPSYFKNRFCRQELEYILRREKLLNREDMIIPLFYVDATRWLGTDNLGKKLAERQYLDWRELRFEGFDSPLMRQSMSALVHRVGAVVERS